MYTRICSESSLPQCKLVHSLLELIVSSVDAVAAMTLSVKTPQPATADRTDHWCQSDPQRNESIYSTQQSRAAVASATDTAWIE